MKRIAKPGLFDYFFFYKKKTYPIYLGSRELAFANIKPHVKFNSILLVSPNFEFL